MPGKLRVVEAVPARPGNADLTRDTMAGWREGQRRCRARGRHNWRGLVVYEHRNHYEVTEQCPDCRNRRTADFSRSGHRLTGWRAEYRDGYLLPKGAARLDEGLHDELWLGEILSRRVVEAIDDEETEAPKRLRAGA